MVKCPKCSNSRCVKDGIIKGRQRYLCKDCKYRHTVAHVGKSPAVKRQALQLYLEGLGFRAIGRFLSCSHVSVYKWIKAFGEGAQVLQSDSTVEVVEMDEMHTYIASKKTTAGFGLLLIDMGKDSSTAFWATVAPQRNKSYGKLPKRSELPK